MKKFLKKSLSAVLLFSTLAVQANSDCSTGVVTLISPRSLGTDGALRLVADVEKQNLFGMDDSCWYGTVSLAGGGGQTFRSGRIAKCLFGPDVTCGHDCASLYISGKCAENRGENDWLADYFGLPTDFKSTVTFKPKITQGFLDFNLYVGFDKVCSGMYFTLRVPFQHVRYELNFHESVTNSGTNFYDEGYFSDAQVPRTNLLASFEEFVIEGKVPNLSGTTNSQFCNPTPITSSVKFDPLTCAKMYGCKDRTKSRVADLSATLGWNFLQDCDYHLGAYIYASAPTGNRPCGEFLFEPIVGNGHHWTVGGGISGHIIFWECEESDSSFGLYVDGHVEHMFKTHQRRFFDLKNKPNSRYMLAEKLGTPVTNLFANPTACTVTNSTVPSAQFKNEYTSVANLTCCDVNVSVDAQGIVVAMFNYSTSCFSWDFGYEFWGRSCDKITVDCNCECPLEANPRTWALKGDAHTYGFVATDSTALPTPNAAIPLSATDSEATIHAGSNVPVGTTCSTGGLPLAVGDTRTNPNIDAPQFAVSSTTTAASVIMFERCLLMADCDTAQQRTSFQPIFLSTSDVDVCGAQSKGLSNSIFTHLSYTWAPCGDCCGLEWTPYLGIGGKAEFARTCGDCCTDNNSCSTESCSPPVNTSSFHSSSFSASCNTNRCDDSCRECSFSQWYIWLKLGASFN